MREVVTGRHDAEDGRLALQLCKDAASVAAWAERWGEALCDAVVALDARVVGLEWALEEERLAEEVEHATSRTTEKAAPEAP